MFHRLTLYSNCPSHHAENKSSLFALSVLIYRSLRELNLEGNQLGALPVGALHLNGLKYLKINNNFMHPLLWRETATNQPQVI